MKKVIVLMGNYGSGKTEIALNLAFAAAEEGKRTELIDLDMVNTYFRLTERRKLIEAREIKLVSPNFAMTNIETLSIPAQVQSAFAQDWDTVIFDVGGDPVGATALGRFRRDFEALPEDSLEVLHVINVRRPLSGSEARILAMDTQLQKNSRLSITGYINNTNLGAETGEGELRDGYEMLRGVSEKSGIPVRFTCGRAPLLQSFLAEKPDERYVGTPMEISIFMHRDWDSFTKHGN